MPRSMTGFGAAEGAAAGGVLQIEVRTVNHRHFSLHLKVPTVFQAYEPHIRDVLRQHIDRGHVSVVARWVENPSPSEGLAIDLERAHAVYTALKTIKKDLKIKEKISLDLIARQPDVLRVTTSEEIPDFEEIRQILVAALEELVAARSREGEHLVRELSTRLQGIAQYLANVEDRAPERVVRERDRLRTAVAELLDGYAVDEDRIAQEVAILADKLDITEESVRLRAHLATARDTLASDGPVGKQLTFLAQEMLREINTIGSKANDADIAHDVISMKGELEKVREQLENVE